MLLAARRRTAIVAVFLGMFGTAWSNQVQGATARTLSSEQVLANADVIFQGVVTAAAPRWSDATHKGIVTDYQIQVERVLRDDLGALAARTINGSVQLTFAGGEIGDRAVDVHGIPTFAVNERVFLFIKKDDLGAMAPTLGLWQGVYRVRPGAPGADRVTHVSFCCGAAATVESSFFSKSNDHQGGFTADQFAGEIVRALPQAREHAELLLPATPERPLMIPFAGGGKGQPVTEPHKSRAGIEDTRTRAPIGTTPAPETRPEPVTNPIAIQGEALDGGPISNPPTLRYGFTRAVPNVPYVFNIPPNMGGFGSQFENMLAYWNSYASDVFRIYTSPNNNISGNNSRNETQFVDSTTLNNLYGQGGWGSTTYAVCENFSINNRIVESDICFNSGLTWTTDYTTGFNSGNTGSQIYFASVALHEQGHAFGLAHSWVFNPGYAFPSIMNYFTYDMQAEARFVYSDDAAGIRAAYPARIISINDFGVYLWADTGGQAGGANPNNLANWSTFPSSVTAGQSFTLSNFFLENVGTIAGSPTLEFYLTPARQSFTGNIYCGSLAFGNFNSFSGGRYSATLNVPAGTPSGYYYVAAYKQGGDSNGGNNSAWSNTRIFVFPTPPPPRPGNDDIANAYSLSVGTVSGTNVNATNDRSGSCGLSNSAAEVWYRVYVGYNGTIDIDTCGSSLDTVLSLWGSTGFFSELACNDDAFLPCNIRASQLSFAMAAGTTRWIRVAGYNGATGTFVLNTRFTASNDLCANAVPVTTGTYYGYTTGSGAEPGDAQCGISNSSPDIWYSYTAQCPGTVHLDTLGSNYDTVLSVRAGCAGATIVCNDDCPGVGLSSCAEFTTTPGVTYLIRVSGYNGNSGAAVLNVSASSVSSNDECYNAAAAYDGLNTVYNQCATSNGPAMPDGCATSPGENLSSDVWYYYAPPVDGTVFVAICTQSYSPAIAVYDSACPSTPEEAIACGAAEADCNTPILSFNGLAGHIYYLRVGAANYGTIGLGQGTATLNITEVPTPTGSCCVVDGSCTIRSQAGCTTVYGGDGSVCDNVVCDVLVGACCAVDGSCSLTTLDLCVGDYHGNASVCEAVMCPILVGACCVSDSTCVISTAGQCIGIYQGDASVCENVMCPLLLGACCAADSTCTIDIAGACIGNFQGEGSVCVNVQCPFLNGACCAADLTCTIATAANCVGMFQGETTVCEAVECLPQTGACCIGHGCSIVSAADCAAASGSYNGAATTCDFPGNPVTCCKANYNHQAGVTVQDIFDFLAGYFSGTPAADFNSSGAITVQDIFDFLAAYFSGCA